MFWILLCVAFTSIIIFLMKKCSYWKDRGVVQDLAFPFFGINWRVLTRQASNIEIFQYLYKKHHNERYIGVYDFLTPLLIIKDPDLLQQVLVKKFEHFTDHRPVLPPDLDPLWNKNVFSLKGNQWKEARSVLSPSFTSNKMRHMFGLMEQCATNFVQHFVLKDEDLLEIEVKETFSRYINDVIASTCFGYQCDSMKDKNNEFYLSGIEGSHNNGYWRHTKFALLRVFPWLSVVLKTSKCGDTTNFFRRIIQESVDFRKRNNVKRPDMITLLMKSKDETEYNDETEDTSFPINELKSSTSRKSSELSVDDIAAHAMVFFFAGFSTLTSLLCFMTYELAVHPDVQDRLMKEIDNLRRRGNKIEYEYLAELSYMHMVISETLRKYPPFCRDDRRCTKSFTIEKVKESEEPLTIDPGSDFWFPIQAIHYDSRFWPEPEKFDPERFSAANKKDIRPGTYMPFGIGPRGCMGYRFVLQTVKILFYELLSDFEIVPVKKTAIPCKLGKNTSHIIPGSGFWFGFKRRIMRP